MSAAKPSASFQVVASTEDSATRRLHLLMRQREVLRPLFRATWDELSHHFDTSELEAWATAVLALANVNAGPACIIAYWAASRNAAGREEIAPLLAAAQAAADICRHAGARPATATLKALPIASRAFGLGPALARWWRVMELLSRQAPEAVELTAARMHAILAPGTIDAFENFVTAGLRAASGDKARRIAFFSLEDELSRRLIARDLGSVAFPEIEVELKAFITALWGRAPLLRGLPTDNNQTARRRASIAGPVIRLPEVYRGVQGEAARTLFRAAAAHAQAHLVLGQGLFPVGTLKPLQIALVNLIEDARIETLAMRQFPGLRRLWSPYHVATPSGVVAAPTLLARLARALFDPAYADDDAFLAKGRAMFAAAMPGIGEAAISREIGMLLGNDLGQMRVQFNVKTYVVEPVYRDDGLGLWDFGENAPSSGEVIELPIEAVRIERQEAKRGEQLEATEQSPAVGKARPVAPDPRGVVIAKYPEWDSAHGLERPEWTTVREVAPRLAEPRLIEEALDRAEVLRNRIGRLVRSVRIGRKIRLNRQREGHDLDVDAMLDAGIALRTGQQPDPRVFRSSTSVHRDLSALLLIDVSESTRDRLTSGATILDVERLAVSVLAEAMGKLGDPFCLLAFASDGREDVRMTSIKAFNEPYGRPCMARLAGLESGLSTRLGAALRHAGHAIGATISGRKLVIVLTDGEPSDVDVADPIALVEDARRAAVGLHAAGIDAYGVVLGEAGSPAATRIFGRGKTMMVHRVEDLPGRLSELYFRLARH
ncbi:nitric oxide reductase activation protein NorD [Bradyrhizobium sp.]|uniref:nitric oxide reductase activation protein NorD n=1 Tax=Bradyrhizobium sp. TaxID=376 RepID=UPI00345D543A